MWPLGCVCDLLYARLLRSGPHRYCGAGPVRAAAFTRRMTAERKGSAIMAKRTATCACGQLRVTCEGEPANVSLCHCLECQRRTGSTFGIAAFFPRQAVQTEGDFRSYRRKADSGFAVHFHFCPVCASTVFWEPERKPDAVAVAVGCFGDPKFPAPSQSVYNDRRHAWVPPLE
jgi:hypothetical protein